MRNRPFLLMESGGLILAFPVEDVRRVLGLVEPAPLPGSVEWLGGLLPGHAEVTPVLKQSFWGGEEGPEEAILVLEVEGRRLAVPGTMPRELSGVPRQAPAEPPLPGHLGWVLEGEGERANCVSVRKLYRTLGLSYNT